MNALKHMELIFGVVVAAGCVAAALPDAPDRPTLPTRPAAAAQAALPVVVVKGKRMTALEKRAAIGGAGGAAATAITGG